MQRHRNQPRTKKPQESQSKEGFRYSKDERRKRPPTEIQLGTSAVNRRLKSNVEPQLNLSKEECNDIATNLAPQNHRRVNLSPTTNLLARARTARFHVLNDTR